MQVNRGCLSSRSESQGLWSDVVEETACKQTDVEFKKKSCLSKKKSPPPRFVHLLLKNRSPITYLV